MTSEQLNHLVARLETQARHSPILYRLRLLLLALLGYGYLALILGGLLLLLLVCLLSVVFLKALALKVALPVAAFVWLVLKAMWVRIEPPVGRRLKRSEAPALFAMIDELRRRLRAPRFHRILVTDDFNAAVVQVPRLGVLGWHRNYLLLGLPLMQSLSPEQFKAVLAHEFGHLAGGHGRLSNWFYRLRMSWQRLMAALEEQRRFGTFLFRRFFNWYAPYFATCSFPLARANEYAADAASARLTSPQALAEALTAVNVLGSYLSEQYWPGIYRAADDVPQPAFAPYAGLGERLAGGLSEAQVQEWLARALARRTSADDTHPSLSDRLQALEQEPRLRLPASEARADRLLGDALAPVTAEFDHRWQQSVQASWQERHEQVRNGRVRLAELEAAVQAGTELSLQDAYERAQLTEQFGDGPEVALALFRAVQAQALDHPVACFALGTRLLARDDASGVALVEAAMAGDDDLLLRGYEALRDFRWRQGRQEEAEALHAKLVARAQQLQAADAERGEILLRDKFDRHGLSEEVLEDLRRQLRAIGGVRKAYLVRKRVHHFPERPLYVLGFVATPWWGLHRRRRVQAIQERIAQEVSFPGETLVLYVDGDHYRFGRKFRFMRGARII